MPTLMPPDATVVITSKNRKDELRAALESAVAQAGVDIEIIAIDDGSTDGTSEMVRLEFPQVRLDRVEQSLGLIVQRNRAARMAKADIVISIDDDAVFSTPNVVAQTLRDFDDKRIGAVAIPFINVLSGPEVLQCAPDAAQPYVTEIYIGTAHGLRREAFIALGGYREDLFHQCEEEDFCIRLLQAGMVVRLGTADPILHKESPRRSRRRIVVYNARNHLLFAWRNVPMPHLPLHLAGTTLKLLQYGIRQRRIGWTLEGLLRGAAAIAWRIFDRHAVTRPTYRLSRWLRAHSPAKLSEVFVLEESAAAGGRTGADPSAQMDSRNG